MRGNITSITQEGKNAARALAAPGRVEDQRVGARLHPRAGRQRRRRPARARARGGAAAAASSASRAPRTPAAGRARPRERMNALDQRVLQQAHQVGGAVHGRAVGHQPLERPVAEPARERARPARGARAARAPPRAGGRSARPPGRRSGRRGSPGTGRGTRAAGARARCATRRGRASGRAARAASRARAAACGRSGRPAGTARSGCTRAGPRRGRVPARTAAARPRGCPLIALLPSSSSTRWKWCRKRWKSGANMTPTTTSRVSRRVERVEGGEPLLRGRDAEAAVVHRAHAAQDHRGVVERVEPAEPAAPVVAEHAEAERAEHDEQAGQHAARDPAHEVAVGQQRLVPALELHQRTVAIRVSHGYLFGAPRPSVK